MLTFPDDFLDSDGRYRAAIPSTPTPVIYIAADGSYVCADCLNNAGAVPHATDAPSDLVTPVGYELLTFGPEICCEHCSRGVAPLYGQDESF